MAKVRGQDVIVGLTDDNFPMLCARNITFDIQRDMLETSIKGSGIFRTFIPGAISWTGSIEGLTFLDVTQDYTITEVYDNMLNGEKIMIRWFEQDVNGAHNFEKTTYAYIESINETSSFDNMAVFTINFKGSGPISLTYA